MDFQSAMETFAEAWVVANAKNVSSESHQTETAGGLDRGGKSQAAAVAPVMFSKEPVTDSKNCPDKSLPVHCIVESITSLEEDRDSWRRKPHVETDSYVIIPVNTAVHELLQVALTRLGYPTETAAVARGAVLLRNWRPLSLDTIAPSQLVTVGELLGELSTVATLRIQVLRTRPSLIHDMKDKLLKLLLIQSHGLLVRSGCPLDTLTLSNLCRDNGSLHHVGEPNDELRSKFDAWVSAQLSPSLSPPFASGTLSARAVGGQPRKDQEDASGTIHSQLAQKTRMRTSFDPELELPKLQKWFQENQHPSRQQIQQYVKELNSLECRRGRKPLDMNNVVYWFKNARAAQKRAELRGFCSPLFNMPVNGFHAFPNAVARRNVDHPLLSDEDMSQTSDSESQHIDVNDSSDTDVPLSLTTTNNNNNISQSQSNGIQDDPDNNIENLKREREPSPDVETNHEDEDSCGRGEDRTSVGEHRPVDDSFTDDEHHNSDSVRSSSLDLRKNCCDDPRSPSPSNGSVPVPRLPPGFPIVPNSMFSHSIMYMSHYMPGLSPLGTRDPALLMSPDERRKRNRTFIDPVTEVPRLEQWFSMNTHPSHNLIMKYTEELNRMAYRQKFPRLEPKNVQFWFKNRRAKCKRLKMSLFENASPYPPN